MNKEYTTDFDIIEYIQKQLHSILKEETKDYHTQLKHIRDNINVLFKELTKIKKEINDLSNIYITECIESDSSLSESE